MTLQSAGCGMFSDEDLKRLRESEAWPHPGWAKLSALLARMQAAEVIVEVLRLAHNGKEFICECSTCDLLAEWRKAAGK